MKKYFLNTLTAAALSAALTIQTGCVSPQPTLEQRLGIPVSDVRQQMLETACMIRKEAVYSYIEEEIGLDGDWHPNGNAGTMPMGGYGSGVALAHRPEGTYILTANHVVSEIEQEITLINPFSGLRRRCTKLSEETSVVTSYSYDNERHLTFETVPAELIASNNHDLALIRTPRLSIRTANRIGSVTEGDAVFGIGYRILPAVESEYLNLNERVVRAFDVGFVKSTGDQMDDSDDQINYISMNTQRGNSGGPVFNSNFELVGLRAHVFLTQISNIEDMINAKAIQTFLTESGYAQLIRPRR